MFNDSSNEVYQLAGYLNKARNEESLAVALEKIEQYKAYLNAYDAKTGYNLLDYFLKYPHYKQEDIFRKLIACGLDPFLPNKEGDFPFLKMIDSEFHKLFIIALPLYFTKQQPPPLSAIFKRLVKTNDANGWKIFFDAVIQHGKLGNLRNIEIDGLPAILYCIKEGLQDSYNALIHKDWDVKIKSKKNFTALHFASVYDPELATKLLDFDSSLYCCNNKNETPLLFAFRKESFSIIDEFFQRREVIELIDQQNQEGNTALHLVLEKLLEEQTTFNNQDEDGFSNDSDSDTDEAMEMQPCDLKNYKIRFKKSFDYLKKILSTGADINIQNQDGETAIQLAKQFIENEENPELQNKIKHIFRKNSFTSKLKKEFQQLNNKLSLSTDEIDAIKQSINILYQSIFNPNSKFNAGLVKNLSDILRRIENQKIINYDEINLYKLIKSLLDEKLHSEIQPIHRETSCKQELPHDLENQKYTFIDGKIIILPNFPDDRSIKNSLITSLIYERKRHDAKDKQCSTLLKLIHKFNSQFISYTLQDYKNHLEQEEAVTKRYYAEYLSDNSDSENERVLQRRPARERTMMRALGMTLFSRSEPDALFTKASLSSEKKQFKKSVGRIERKWEQRIKIHHSTLSDQVHRDLATLNYLVHTKQLDTESIKTLSTKFVTAQYRGTHARTTTFSQAARRAHFKQSEIGRRLYSAAVFTHENIDNFIPPSDDTALYNYATQLKEQIKNLSQSGPVRVKMGPTEYTYDSALNALQDLYTKDYDKFHSTLEEFHSKFATKEHVKIDTLYDLILLSLDNGKNPMVSTSDTPDHALRYAKGKLYQGQKEAALTPNWDIHGKAERHKVGKVYITLCDPNQLLTESNHLISLNATAETRVSSIIVSERETSFFSLGGEVVSQTIFEYPSFDKPYKEIYLNKYGLTKELYELFQKEIQTLAPHSQERQEIENILTNHLISFHEVCLIEEARITAEERNAILVYRDETGGFSLYPPIIHATTGLTGQTKDSVAHAKQTMRQNEKRKRAEEIPTCGFFNNLFRDFEIIAIKDKNSFVASLAFLMGKTLSDLEREISLLPNTADENMADFEQIAAALNCRVVIHCAGKEPITFNDQSELETYNLYQVGERKFAALQAKDEHRQAAKRLHNEPAPSLNP